MLKNIWKRWLSLMLVVLMLVGFIPNVAFAANVNTGVDGLTAESSGSATWTPSGVTITGAIKAQESSGGCGGTSYTAQTGTLTFTNSSGAVGLLTFDYSLTLNGGSATVDGATVTAGASFSKKLTAGETVAVEITSNAANETATTITLTSLKLTPEQNVTVTFKAPTNGTYTVDGTAITADTPITKLTTDTFALAATPASGYKFLGWYNVTTGGYIAYTASVSRSFTANATVEPQFVSSSAPIFQVGTNLFTDLNVAINYAVSSDTEKIALISDGTLPEGDYTIPSGKILLIPFDAGQTVYKDKPEVVYGSHSTPSAYQTLTMASGANITVANGGAISVPSKLCATGTGSGSWNGTPTGKHGRITMNAGSSIDVQSGGKLYVYGYISGSGNVYARSGSEIWECFQIRCWRGGTATSGMADNSQKVFPLNQYYVQNIEAPITYYPGATEKVYTAVNMSSQAFAASATFIGSGGMFQISNGSATKRFTGASDRLGLNIDGNFRVTPMSLTITGLPLIGTLDLNTSDYVLPIQSNITLNINSGTTTVSQDVAFLPGSEMIIANGATATIASGHKSYVYDQDQWGAYAASGQQLVPVGYSTVNGTTAKRTAASLVDAKIDVNGTLNVAGSLYTTESGAAIISSQGTGKVVLTAAPGTETNTYQATQSGSDMTYVSIPITAAKLQNADGTYYETAGKPAGTEIPYAAGVWGGEAHAITVSFEPNGGTGEMDDQIVNAGTTYTFPACTFTREGYDFVGWTSEQTGDQVFAAGSTFDIPADFQYDQLTLKAKWEIKTFTVTWIVDDVTTTTTVEYNAQPVYNNGADPFKAPDDQYTYTFTGWQNGQNTYPSAQLPAVTGNVTYTAVFSTTTNTYTITWVIDGTTETETYEYGAMPEYTGETPTKDPDAQYTYTFVGWSPLITTVTGDATYTAVFEGSVRSYTVTWVIDGVSTKETYEYGAMPSHADPTKEATAQYSYTFAGWDPAITTVTGDATYTAQFTETVNSYTVTWVIDGTTETETYEYGAMPSRADPTKEATAQYTYTFAGWTPEITTVTGDATYTAQFSQTLNTYTVTWVIDGNEETETYEYGAMPEYTGETPTKDPDAQYTYTFTGWDPEITTVTGDATYTAQFSQTLNTYTVTWVIDGNEETETYEYGATPVYTGETPTKDPDAQYTYTFVGWRNGESTYEPDKLPTVTGEATYTAVFEGAVRSYTIKFVNFDNEELKSYTLAYGATPVYDGQTPVKPADAQYTYTFTGWTPEITTVSGEATYTATFTETVNKYLITFVNDDVNHTVLQSTEVAYGTMPEYTGETPTKTSVDTVYTFAGWTPEVVAVTGAATYTATYTSEVRKYTVTFKNYDGSVLQESQVAYGATPAFTGETPVKPDDAQYTYTFTGWTPEITTVSGNAEYTATYTSSLRSYVIVFENYDGSVLQSTEVEYGATPSYTGETPVKPADAENTYTFAGWDPEIATVTGAATYTARFTETKNEYTVTFKNYDGLDLQTYTLAYGDAPAYLFTGDEGEDLTPVKPEDVRAVYTFSGWTDQNGTTYGLEDELPTVTGDATYTAAFAEELKSYTITFVNWNGEELQRGLVTYGTTPSYTGETPVRAEDAAATYVFSGWDPQIAEVTGNATYTATFTATPKTYTVTWKNWDGQVLETDAAVPYGETPSFNGETPVKTGDAQYSYTFTGWDPAITTVTGDATYTAQFSQTVKTYTVTWVIDGVSTTETYEYGATPSHADPTKEATAQYTYTFTGWDPEIAMVTGDATYTAQFSETVNTYTVTWVIDGVSTTETYAYGATPTHADPTKAPDAQYTYTFAGWDPAIAMVTGDATYTAQFTATVNSYTVTWVIRDTTETETYAYGGTPAHDDPDAITVNSETEEGTYTFTAWDKEITTVTGDVTYTATFTFTGLKFSTDGTQYFVADVLTHEGWTEFNGRKFYFDPDDPNGYALTGLSTIGEDQYVFNDMGEFQKDLTGLYLDGADTYWVENGVVVKYKGLVRLVLDNGDINYYYFGEDNKAVKNKTFEVVKNNGLRLPANCNYNFDANGVIEHDRDTSKNGVSESSDNGGLYYMIDGVHVGVGLFMEDNYIYYARTSTAEIVCDRWYYVAKTNNVYQLSPGLFYFDQDGHLQLNGWVIVSESSKTCTYYYVDGQLAKGFTKIGDDYYFFNTGSGKLYKDVSLWVPENNYGITPGMYNFDADGKLVKTGFVTDTKGNTYYMVNLELAKGFTKIGDDYYLFNRANGRMYKDMTLWVNENENGYDIKGGMYYFGADGKMRIPDTVNGSKQIVNDNGKLYFTIDGMRMTNGLNDLNGEYYYAQASGLLAVNTSINIRADNAYGIEGGWYAFDADGKLVKTGFIAGGDGYTYYRADMKLAKGLTKVGEDFYFFNKSTGKLYKDMNLWVGDNSYGVVTGMHYFNAEGKMSD